jgi:DNA polymerase-1
VDIRYVTNPSECIPFFEDLLTVRRISLDVETTSLDTFVAKWLLLQLKLHDHIYVLDVRKLGLEYVTSLVTDLKRCDIPLIGHNLKYDLKVIYNNTGVMLTNVYDTMLAECLIYLGVGSRFYSLANLVEKYVGETLDKDIRETFANYEGEITQEQIVYSALDISYLESIQDQQLQKIDEQKERAILDLEMEVLPVFTHMEIEGVYIDRKQWLAAEAGAKEKAEEYKNAMLDFFIENIPYKKFDSLYEVFKAIRIPFKSKSFESELLTVPSSKGFGELLREHINLGSPYQIKALLGMVGIDVQNTNEKVLKDHKDKEIVQHLLSYREQAKRVSTYGESFLDTVHPVTKRVHTSFHQLGTATGRVASDQPNLQNIPALQIYRSAFRARPDYKIITADYSQAELRLLGAVSGEPLMIDAYKRNLDLHSYTATLLYGCTIDEVDKEKRKKGKALNFGIVYGISEYGLYFNFGIPLDEGKSYLRSFFGGYKTLKKFIDMAGEKIWELKYSITPMGRRRYFENKTFFADSKELWRYKGAVLREGINHIIQGGSADIVKTALKYMYYRNPFGHDKFRILLQEHDEIVVEVHESIAGDAEEFVRTCMLEAEQPWLGEIPAEVDIHVADFWTKD